MIGEQFEPRQIPMTMSEYELAATTEAVYDALLRRVRWVVTREPSWVDLDWEVAKESISQLTSAYSKVMFTLRDLPEEALHPDFFETYRIGPTMWDIINQITFGESWSDAPTHPHTPYDSKRPPCKLCDAWELA